MNVRPIHFCDLTVEGELLPVFGWTIESDEGTILVDTGMVDSTPEIDAEFGPVVLHPWWSELGEVRAVINTHLHFDHCGGNRRFAGTPTYVQRVELEAAVAPAYLEEWVRFPGESYVELEGDAQVFPGVSVLFTPGHSKGHQAVLVDTDDGLTVLGGDVTHSMDDLIAGATPSIMRVHELQPRRVYLAHYVKAWEP